MNFIGSIDLWRSWQKDVVDVVRQEFRDLFHSMHVDDFDWDAWRPLFEEGLDPRGAVLRAFSRVEARFESARIDPEGQVGLGADIPSVVQPVSAMYIAVD